MYTSTFCYICPIGLSPIKTGPIPGLIILLGIGPGIGGMPGLSMGGPGRDTGVDPEAIGGGGSFDEVLY